MHVSQQANGLAKANDMMSLDGNKIRKLHERFIKRTDIADMTS